MSAIYQKARPIRWDEVVGQEHVKDVLRASIERGRLGHAYLFSGPRGVGKTTTARLIAMAANCERDAPKPCGECSSCLAVRAGSHPDVLEIDAASNNSVDDVRELREKVGLAAMRGGKKIYILDEAHMMSRAAFNALLKTLEEPPSHVIFILATTEPEKILPTILSRCQHYRFRRLSDAEIAGKLAAICEQEGVRAEGEALNLIGRLADGAMRDGESLLERMLAGGEDITRQGVEAALGLPPSERVADMARALVLGDAETLLALAGELYREGFAARTVVEGLKSALRGALHAELGLPGGTPVEGAEVPRLLRLQAALDEQESRFARGADLMSLELALTHALLAGDGAGTGGMVGGGVGGNVGAPTIPADVTARLVKLERDLAALRSASKTTSSSEVADFEPGARSPTPSDATRPVLNPTALTSIPVTEAPKGQAPKGQAPKGSWPDVLRLADIKLRALLKVARANPVAGGALVISYDDRYKFHAKQVLDQFDEVAALVQRVYGAVEVQLDTPEGSKKKWAREGDVSAPPVSAQAVSAPPAATALAAQTHEAPVAARPASPRPEVAASPQNTAQDIPDFSPTRRPAVRATAPAPAPQMPVPQMPAPRAAPTSAEAYDPEPVIQEPSWEDAPPREPARRAATVAAPAETAWADLGDPGAHSPRPEPRAPEPVPTARPTGRATSRAAVSAHPMFEEAARLFPGKLRDSGQLKRPKARASAGAEPEEVTPENVEAAEAEAS